VTALVAGKFPSILFMLHATDGHAGTICMQLAAIWAQFVCDWLPLGYNLNATGHQSQAIFACNWRPVYIQLFELKNEETI
jgi:hypothetical protein